MPISVTHKKLGERIRTLRIEKHVSQQQFANIIGLHRSYIGFIERGERNITLKVILNISEGLNIDFRELFLF